MSRDLGISPVTPAPPPALRAARRGWRDPRLWLGVLLIAGSVVLGARLLAAADDTVTVWGMAADRGSGTPVAAGDLAVQRVRFSDGAALAHYFPADQPVPDDLVLTRAVGAGEPAGPLGGGRRGRRTGAWRCRSRSTRSGCLPTWGPVPSSTCG
ncbi:hypothetical protein G5V59_08545 [Nocardioides sp. W3-2-3]|uniref:hypothetical protein n=1 Tax=Nocardioides convexus TaxID=2712224 RepID=UPI00241846C6|nr:hypothetical protein [Nocardioides convexus]NHA00170.1 hypothetical protein [Nocardioides convexus]